MTVADDTISEISMGVDNRLPDRWRTEMSDMCWLSDIGPYIIHHNRLAICWFILWHERREELAPGTRSEAEIDVAAHDGGVLEVFGSRIYRICELLGDHRRGESGGFRKRKYAVGEVSELFFWGGVERERSDICVRKRVFHYI